MSNTEKKQIPLEFEQPLMALSEQIAAIEKQLSDNPDVAVDLAKLHEQYDLLKRSLYAKLRPIDHLAIARHSQRPYIRDYLQRWDPNWIEMHGDRHGADDPAMVIGMVTIGGHKVMVAGTQKGRSLKDKQLCNFGMPQPEGYRKALRAFKHAEKFNLPIVTLIDTPGAYPGMTAEVHNQSEAIARNLFELAGLTVPVVAIVTGEGGSGGALAIGVANRLLMLEHSVYSTISPEGCASILWRSADKVAQACEAMKMTASELKKLGIADEVVGEPLGGAHNNYDVTAQNLEKSIIKQLDKLSKLSPDKIRDDRQTKFRKIGSIKENI